MSEVQLHSEYDLHLIYLGQDVYGELKEKVFLTSSISVNPSESDPQIQHGGKA